MIMVRVARRAALSATVASLLLAGMAVSAKAQTSTGGGTTPPSVRVPDFVDSPNTDASGPKTGSDLLSHGGFQVREAFMVSFTHTRDSPYNVNPDGSLAGDGGDNNVWSGTGELPPDHKAIATLAKIRIQYDLGVAHYEYRLTATGTDESGKPLTPVTVSGGIHSYTLSQ